MHGLQTEYSPRHCLQLRLLVISCFGVGVGVSSALQCGGLGLGLAVRYSAERERGGRESVPKRERGVDMHTCIWPGFGPAFCLAFIHYYHIWTYNPRFYSLLPRIAGH